MRWTEQMQMAAACMVRQLVCCYNHCQPIGTCYDLLCIPSTDENVHLSWYILGQKLKKESDVRMLYKAQKQGVEVGILLTGLQRTQTRYM